MMADRIHFRRTLQTNIRLDGNGMLITGGSNNSEVPANNTVLFDEDDDDMPELIEDTDSTPMNLTATSSNLSLQWRDRSQIQDLIDGAFPHLGSVINHFEETRSRFNDLIGHMREFNSAQEHTHENFKYVPEVFALPTVEDIVVQSMHGQTTIWRKLKHHFPGATFETFADYTRFMQTPTFFRAKQAPADEEDLYANAYTHCDYVYVLVAPDKCKESLIFYSSEELVGTFLHYGNLVNPKDVQQSFTEMQMRRLLLIADEALHETVEYFLIHQSDSIKQARKMQQQQPESFRKCLEMILEIGMYMRGWDGKGDYPLRSMQTVGEVNGVKLSKKLFHLKNKLEDSWNIFKDLQLMKYTGNAWRASKDDYNKLYERIGVVIEGRHAESCIRLTSNRFAASAWIYLKELYNTTAFEIEQLRDIV